MNEMKKITEMLILIYILFNIEAMIICAYFTKKIDETREIPVKYTIDENTGKPVIYAERI